MFEIVVTRIAGLKLRKRPFILPIVLVLIISACDGRRPFPGPSPSPQPTELAMTPLPAGVQAGGLAAAYASVASIDGGQGERCHRLYRFYPDGLALFASMACSSESPSLSNWAEIAKWFRRENPDISRGDYYRLGQRIFVRIVRYNHVYETYELISFEGEQCGQEMVLQEPRIHYYSGVPSELTQPVQEYFRIDKLILGGEPSDPGGEACQVPGFKILFRPTITLAGGQIEYRIQTDPGEICTLTYTYPDGTPSQAAGTGTIRADRQGICYWIWEIGEQEGYGMVTVRIGEIEQNFQIDVR